MADFNEEQFLDELKKFGYEYELEHDEETDELLYVNIYPKCKKSLWDDCRVDSDVIDFMLSKGFKIDQVIFYNPMVGVFVSFYRG